MRFLAVLGLATAVWAADEGSPDIDREVEDYLDTLTTEDVLVTVKRPLEVPLPTPTSRTILTPDMIDYSGAGTVQDFFTGVAGIRFWDETGTDSKPNFTLRGLNPDRGVYQAILVDGVPIEAAPYGHPGKSLFPFVLERAYAVDVHRGGYSVLYGPNTVAGVINFKTIPIPDKPMFMVRERIASHNDWSTYLVAGGRSGNVGAVVESAYRTGDSHRENGDYTIQSHGAKIQIDLSKALTLLVQFDYYRDDSRLSDGLSLAAFQENPYQTQAPFNYFTGYQTRGNVRLQYQIDEVQSIELLTYAYTGDREFVLQQPVQSGDAPTVLRHTPRPMTVWAFQPTYSAEIDGLGAHHDVKAGFRYHRESIDTFRFDESIPFLTYTYTENLHVNYDVWSLFVQDAIRIGERLLVVPGVRAEIIDVAAVDNIDGDTASRDFDEFLPAISASYLFTDALTAFANVQTSYRPPSYSQILGSSPGISGERSENYEIGLRTLLGDVGVYGALTYFLIDFHDQYETDPNDTDQLINLGKTRTQGVELEWDWRIGRVWESVDGLRLRGAYSYIDSEIRTGQYAGNQIPRVGPHQFSATLQYDHESGLWGGVTGTYTDENFSDPANTVQTTANGYNGLNPSFWMWGLRAGYRRDVLDERATIDVELGINNLFDTDDNYAHRSGKGLIKGIDRIFYGVIRFSYRF